ncbi:S8 family peptidase [Niabella terrae]
MLCAQPAPATVRPGWHYLDPLTDGYRGISLNQAYQLLQGRPATEVIVAVIDSGIDTLQPDLQPVLWSNPKERPGNGRDDDGNGLVDDYHGWNYLGAPDGENLAMSISEEYRTYHRFKAQFEGRTVDTTVPARQWQFREWSRAKQRLETARDQARSAIGRAEQNLAAIRSADQAMQGWLDKVLYTVADLDSVRRTLENQPLIDWWRRRFTERGGGSNVSIVKTYDDYCKGLQSDLVKLEQPPDPVRDRLLKDDGYDIRQIHYGNHNLSTHSGYHGTSVSSVIGAVRGNGLGIDGIADHVRIMMIRGILGKDEFDKDVALSIRYAVDHGAKVINMSFGKYISPDKQWVDEALAYALSKDVLLVHAAGNDASDNDRIDNYPASVTLEGKQLPHLLQVGASGDESLGAVVAPFSNYGAGSVDVFAPGMSIEADIAGSGTQLASGTSLASPIVAGIAALLRSYFPELTATEVAEIIKASGTKVNETVIRPGTSDEKVAFSTLCRTGKIVNAAGAVRLALRRQQKVSPHQD